MRKIGLMLAAGLVLLLAACSGAPVGTSGNTDLSPREEARQVQDTYVVLLTAASTAIDTNKLPGDVVKKIAAASHAATDAERAYVAEAKKCWRDQETGVVGDTAGLPEGQHCTPSTVSRLLSAFTMQTGSLQGTLAAFGVNVTL
jgi:hypothetical protein